MEKISPKAWLRFARKKPQLIEVSFHKTLPPALKNNGWVQKPLYTREAIEQAVKAAFGKIGVELIHDLTDEGFEKLRNIDLDAIINQLTGE